MLIKFAAALSKETTDDQQCADEQTDESRRNKHNYAAWTLGTTRLCNEYGKILKSNQPVRSTFWKTVYVTVYYMYIAIISHLALALISFFLLEWGFNSFFSPLSHF